MWKLLILKGIVFVGIALMSFLYPFQAFFGFAVYLGVGVMLNGAFILASAFLNKAGTSGRKWLLVFGILDLVSGMMLQSNIMISMLLFPFVTGFWIILTGLFQIAGSIAIKDHVKGWQLVLLVGLLSIFLGGFIMANPFASNYKSVYLIGIYSLTTGILYLVYSFRVRKFSKWGMRALQGGTKHNRGMRR